MKMRLSLPVVGLLCLAWLWPLPPAFAARQAKSPFQVESTATAAAPVLTPADVIEAVNTLRVTQGLNALSVHPVLMEVAALQAGALAASEGVVGHERPCGLTLGQQLLQMGFPLWGDLGQDGYRSENWVAAPTLQQAMAFWQGDAEHANTMLSEYRSDIGAAVAVSDQIYVVLETALRTNTGQHQSTAYAILTSIPITQAACLGLRTPNAAGSLSEYSVPVALSTARPDGDVVHEVRYGQTLWSLAIEYQVSIDQIKRLNGLTSDTIAPGWKLLIQKAATQPAPRAEMPPMAPPIQSATPYRLPTWTGTAAPPAPNEAGLLVDALSGNQLVVAALIISFSVLVAGVIGFGRKSR